MANSAKSMLRRQLLVQRQALSSVFWREQSDQICRHLQNCTQFQQARTILTYCSHRQEPDLSYLLDRTDKRWGLPRCMGKDLLWHSWEPQQALVTGAYGILEPSADLPLLEPSEVDLMLVPCVGIDRSGYRLGYGGGYYDRLRADPLWRNVPTIGIVFDFGYVDVLPIEPWDLPLDGICTELGLISVLEGGIEELRSP
jgi:5-formyltetrahydrofolate cyclo-ligase